MKPPDTQTINSDSGFTLHLKEQPACFPDQHSDCFSVITSAHNHPHRCTLKVLLLYICGPNQCCQYSMRAEAACQGAETLYLKSQSDVTIDLELRLLFSNQRHISLAHTSIGVIRDMVSYQPLVQYPIMRLSIVV